LKLKGKLAQYGKRIFNLTGTEEIANEAINKTFFHTMGMDTKLSDYTKDFDKTANFIVNRFEERGWLGLKKTKYQKSKSNCGNELLISIIISGLIQVK
jgi:alcohol dehydrogenase YqhD (iron-dependent ADH family)